jgi:uncharacterized membrane-anchored protein YitT (DUF2179 family)
MKTLQTLYIGLNDKDKHKQLLLTSTYKDKISKILYAYGIHSFTMLEAQGFYKSELENTLVIQVFNMDIPKVCIKDIKQELNQECIMLTLQELEVKFI